MHRTQICSIFFVSFDSLELLVVPPCCYGIDSLLEVCPFISPKNLIFRDVKGGCCRTEGPYYRPEAALASQRPSSGYLQCAFVPCRRAPCAAALSPAAS